MSRQFRMEGSTGWKILNVMPKMKTHSSAKKRFKVTANGKIKHRHANTSHLLRKRSTKRKRHLRQDAIVSKADEKRIRRLLCI